MRWSTMTLVSLLLAGCGGDDFEEKAQTDAGNDQAQVPDVAAEADAPGADAQSEADAPDADAAVGPDATDAGEEAEAGPPAVIAFTQTAADFADTWLFAPSQPIKLTLSNTSPNAAAKSGPIGITLDNNVDFSIVENHCEGMPLMGQASCDVHVVLKPAHADTVTAKLIALADPGGTSVVNLSGKGKTSVTLAQDIYSQWPGSTTVGSTSEGQFFLQNTSSQQVGPMIFTFEPPNSIFEFVPNTCEQTVPASGSCHPHVRFKPTMPGTFKGTLRVVVPDAGGAEASFTFVSAL